MGLPDQTPFSDGHAHPLASTRRRPRVWSMVLCGALGVGALAWTAPSSPVSALGSSVVSPAALQQGLQGASRLTEQPPREPLIPADVQQVLDRTNAERTARGFAPLAYHEKLAQAAEAHAADQYSRDCVTQISHTGTDGSDTRVRIGRTGLDVRNWAENIACGQRTPTQVVTAWMNSSGHRANILNPALTHIGISVSRDSDGRMYWVQVFGTPR